MATSTTEQLRVHFPATDGALDQDREWCEVEQDGRRRRVRFHDYDEIFEVPGLYEAIFYEHLACSSPEMVAGLLAEQLEAAAVEPATLRAIDVGAGNGLVGEALAEIGVESIVGVDILAEAGLAAERDRPGLYDDYVVCDLTALAPAERRRLSDQEATCLTLVAALGYGDIPPRAFAEAYNLVQEGGWIAFNIKADFLDDGDASGFKRLIARMLDDGLLDERARRRYDHRLSVAGEPLAYVAMVGVKRGDVPADWTA